MTAIAPVDRMWPSFPVRPERNSAAPPSLPTMGDEHSAFRAHLRLERQMTFRTAAPLKVNSRT